MKEEKIEDNKKKEIDMKQTEKENKKINKEKIKDMANKFFNSIGFPIIIGILLFLKTIFFYQNTISVRETIDKETILGTITMLSTIIWAICVFLPNRGRIITTIIVDILASILLLADNLYHTYSSSVLSVAQIMNLQYGEEIMSTLPMKSEAKRS